MADSSLRTVTGVAMVYSNRSAISVAEPAGAIELASAIVARPLSAERTAEAAANAPADNARHARLALSYRRVAGGGAVNAATAPAVNRRRDGLILRQLGALPLNIFRRIQLADERNRLAGDQRQMHIRPVLAGRVVDDRPAFERGLRRFLEQQPVARFPGRHRHDVSRLHVARFRIGRIDIDAALVLRARAGQRREIILELQLQLRIGEANRSRRREIHVAQFAGIHQQRQLFALGMVLIAGDQPRRDDRARDLLRTEFHLDARAFELIDHGAERLRRC